MNCDCPLSEDLTTIPAYTCPENMGQIQKLVFQRSGFVFDADGVPTANPIDVLASWEPLLTAADETKVVVTPFITEFQIPQNAPVTFGGNDNTTLDGIVRVDGIESVTVTAMLTSVPAKVVKIIRDILMCREDLVFFGINEFNQIVGRDVSVAQDGSQIEGIPIGLQSGFVSDASNQGKNTRDTAMLQFSLAPEWRNSLVIVKPVAPFNPKRDIVPAA